MKASSSIFFFFLLLLALSQMEARRTPEDYWKHVMGDGPIPEAIADLLVSNQEGKDPVVCRNCGDSTQMGKLNWDSFIKRDFDTKSVAIIYHHHDDDHHAHTHLHGNKAL